MSGKGNRLIETRLLSEWLAVRYPERRVMQRVRVGSDHPSLEIPGLTPAEARMAMAWRRWCDALVFDNGQLLVVEATVFPKPGKISQLDLYMMLVPTTPELVEFRDWPLRGVLLCAIDDPVMRRLASDRGYTIELYHPPWVSSYLASLTPGMRAPSLTALP